MSVQRVPGPASLPATMTTGHEPAYRRLPMPARRAAAAAVLRLVDGGKWLAVRSYPLFERAIGTPRPGRDRRPGGAGRAARRIPRLSPVPAYRAFVDRPMAGATTRPGRRRAARPLPDHRQALVRAALDDRRRCLDGRVPLRGTEMDESVGVVGRAVRLGARGRWSCRRCTSSFSQFAHYLFGGPFVTLNGFSMGAWSTGVNTARALGRNGLVKSPGPTSPHPAHAPRARPELHVRAHRATRRSSARSWTRATPRPGLAPGTGSTGSWAARR
jgi:hypothetical protein